MAGRLLACMPACLLPTVHNPGQFPFMLDGILNFSPQMWILSSNQKFMPKEQKNKAGLCKVCALKLIDVYADN